MSGTESNSEFEGEQEKGGSNLMMYILIAVGVYAVLFLVDMFTGMLGGFTGACFLWGARSAILYKGKCDIKAHDVEKGKWQYTGKKEELTEAKLFDGKDKIKMSVIVDKMPDDILKKEMKDQTCEELLITLGTLSSLKDTPGATQSSL